MFMKKSNALLLQATVDELRSGVIHDAKAGEHRCLFCDAVYEDGCVYPDGARFFEASRAAREHVAHAHGGAGQALLDLGKGYAGMTDIQQRLVQLSLRGYTDDDIGREMGIAASTVRNHRFKLRERVAQARVFLAVMDIMERTMRDENRLIPVPASTPVSDERFAVTAAESQKIEKRLFDGDGALRRFPTKAKEQIVVLRRVLRSFAPDLRYSEKEVNEMLGRSYEDYALLRRLLVDYGFLDRKRDGSEYWVRR